jgi:hypothetical protein
LNTQTQRFSGRTAEEAVLNAIDALGEDAEVVDARRVKRPGLLGVLGGEVVVVTARPRGASAGASSSAKRRGRTTPDAGRRAGKGRKLAKGRAPAAAPTTDVAARRFRRSLRAAMDDTGAVGPDDEWYRDLPDQPIADAATDHRPGDRFDGGVLDLTDEQSGPGLDLRDRRAAPLRDRRAAPRGARLPERFTDDDLAPLPPPPPGVVARAILSLDAPPPLPNGIAVAANPAVIDLRSHARQRARNASLAPPPPPPPPPPQQPVPERTGSVVDLIRQADRAGARVQWSRANLRAIGVPERVLEYLPATDPVSDTIWTMAFETAVWWTLRKHRPRTNLVVDGYGAEGAMALLEAVLEGHVIRYLHLGERSVDATPREIAKAVRSCLPR